MCFGIMRLSDIKEVTSPSGIEITQDYIREIIGFAKILQNLLYHKLGASIGIYRVLGVRFCDWDLVWIAIGRTSGAKDNVAAVKLTHNAQEIERVGYIVEIVFLRVLHGFAHIGKGGKVQHTGDVVGAKNPA